MLGNKNNLLGKINCILLLLSLSACGGGGSSSDGDNSNVTPPITVTPPIITPTYNGKTEQADIDIASVKPIILDVIYALDTANILIFGAEKRFELLRPENDFRYVFFGENGDDECSSGSLDVDFGEFEDKIKNGETVDITGQIFNVTYHQCAIGNFVLSGTAQLFVKAFDSDSFDITSFNLYTDKTLELTIDSVNYQLQGTTYGDNEKEFTLDLLLSTTNENQNIYFSEFSVKDIATESSLDERLNYNGNIYFSQIGKVEISSNNNEQYYTFSGKNEHKIILNFSELNSRYSDNLGFVNLELITSYYSYPNRTFYLNRLNKEDFLASSNLNAFSELNIYQFIFPLGTQIEVSPEIPPTISGFVKQEWQLIEGPDGVDKALHYGPSATYQLTHYGDYTLKNVTTDTSGTERVVYKSFSVPKPNNISATIQVITSDWQLGNTFQAKVVSESTPDFTASLAFGPSGMTVTEGGDISWDGDFFDFGNRSKLHFGIYVETASGKNLIKHTIVIDSKLDKKQFKLAHLTYDTALYPDNINKHRSKFLYKKNNTLSYSHTISKYGFSRLNVSAESVDIDYIQYEGDSFALTLFDVNYNLDNDVIDYLLLQNTLYPGQLAEDRLKVETDLPWVLFNSNKLENYVEVIGNESSSNIDVINRLDAKFVEFNNNSGPDVVYSNTNNQPDNKLKIVDQYFAVQSELQSEKITKIINSCKLNNNEQILISYDNYVHTKNDGMVLYSLRNSLSSYVGESNVFTLDKDNDNYCDTLLFVSNLSKAEQIHTLIEAFQITSAGPVKLDSMELERLYSFQQLKTIYDVDNSSQNIILFDRSSNSNFNTPNEPVNAYIVSLSVDSKIIQKPLVYGSGFDIELSPNKSHIINLVDTDDDGVDEVIIKHNLSANEKFIEQYAKVYEVEDNNYEVNVIARLNNGVLEPTYVSELLAQKGKHISINNDGDVVVNNGLQPFIVTSAKEVKTPNGFEHFIGNNIFINNDGTRYQITDSGLEKYSSSNQKFWTTPNVPADGSKKYRSLRVLGKYQDIVLINYGNSTDLYFINDNTGELIFHPNLIHDYSISPDFNETGLLFFDTVSVEGATGIIQGNGVYRANDITGVELVHNWNFSSKYRIRSMNISWINIDDDTDFEILFRFDKGHGNNEALTADYNGENQSAYPITEFLFISDDLSRSWAWDTKKQGYFSGNTYRSKLTGEIIWQIPFNSFFSDTTYKNGIKKIAVSDNNLYLFKTQ